MVALSAQYNFSSVIDEFLALKPFTGPNANLLRQQVRDRAGDVLNREDIRYMPAFKLLDIVAAMVNVASDISAEHQLRSNEASALLASYISDQSPLVSQFMLEAALERARYEPMMLEATGMDTIAYRNLTLTKRWQAMLAAHQAHAPLPEDWAKAVSAHVLAAIEAPAFTEYRVGPLLQLFAEMLQITRDLHDSATPLSQLADHIGDHSSLWKRYVLKVARYREREPEQVDEQRLLPAQSRVPTLPLPPKHSLH